MTILLSKVNVSSCSTIYKFLRCYIMYCSAYIAPGLSGLSRFSANSIFTPCTHSLHDSGKFLTGLLKPYSIGIFTPNCLAVLSDSSGSLILRLFPQPLHVAYGWDAEEAFVLPIEVGGVVVPHAIGCTCRVEVFAQHQTAGLLQPQLLLELRGAHRCDGLEVLAQPGDAHAQLSRESLNAQWLVEVVAQSCDRSGDGGGVAPQDCQVTEPTTLLSYQEPIDNFPCDQRPEDPRFVRGIQQPREPHEGVQQVC